MSDFVRVLFPRAGGGVLSFAFALLAALVAAVLIVPDFVDWMAQPSPANARSTAASALGLRLAALGMLMACAAHRAAFSSDGFEQRTFLLGLFATAAWCLRPRMCEDARLLTARDTMS